MDLIELSNSSSNYAWQLMAFNFILDPFSDHHIVICPILNISLIFSPNQSEFSLILAKNESEFSLILCI